MSWKSSRVPKGHGRVLPWTEPDLLLLFESRDPDPISTDFTADCHSPTIYCKFRSCQNKTLCTVSSLLPCAGPYIILYSLSRALVKYIQVSLIETAWLTHSLFHLKSHLLSRWRMTTATRLESAQEFHCIDHNKDKFNSLPFWTIEQLLVRSC